MSDQERKIRSELININKNEPLFHSYSVLLNKYSDSCNDINDPYTK